MRTLHMQPAMPMCSACGKHPVDAIGQLCNSEDDDGLWLCAQKAAYFAARWHGRYQPRISAQADYVYEGTR